MKTLIYITMFLMSGIWFASCRSVQYVPIESIRTEYKTRDSIRFDSIYQRDSVLLFVKGDTVYKEKYKYLYKYQYVNSTDTVLKTDSIQVPFPVEKRLTRWQSIKLELGGWSLGIIILFILIIIGRIIFKFKNN